MKCKMCKFFNEVSELLGECRIYAPRPSSAVFSPVDSRLFQNSEWPRVKNEDYCGEFEPAKTD